MRLPRKQAALAVATGLMVMMAAATPARAQDQDWKGAPENNALDMGALSGLGILDGDSGFALMGTVAKNVVPDGWASDVADSVSAEIAAGGFFRSGSSAFLYGLHLRWDFQKDEHWLFYGLGGLGGAAAGEAFRHRFEIYPRFAMGTMYSPSKSSIFRVRAELSHELIAVGVNFPLWM